MLNKPEETIVALATAVGVGAISVIRVSGENAIDLVQRVFKGKDLTKQKSHTVHYGKIVDSHPVSGAEIEIDEVMVTIFRAPKSFTTENSIEISCHGSPFIAGQILQVLLKHGARMAKPGEFTLRAFLKGRIDLSQAEAVADLIASNSSAAHEIALKQMRGGFSTELKNLRNDLLNFVSLIELELDFSEEDVEFVDRSKLLSLVHQIQKSVLPLADSFRLGNVIKEGVNTVIIGKPNVGKSTLLNALLNEERAIVSEIAGTTRDTIEEAISLNGIVFRFIDTAGLRETADVVEKIGVKKSYDKIKLAAILIYICDATLLKADADLQAVLDDAAEFEIPFLLVANKSDLLDANRKAELLKSNSVLLISAKSKTGMEELKMALFAKVAGTKLEENQTIVTNLRHFQSLQNCLTALEEVSTGIKSNRSGELLSQDLRAALDALGEITGEVTNDEILGNIFGKFCIGK
jgi:tRNA modification GTPase